MVGFPTLYEETDLGNWNYNGPWHLEQPMAPWFDEVG